MKKYFVKINDKELASIRINDEVKHYKTGIYEIVVTKLDTVRIPPRVLITEDEYIKLKTPEIKKKSVEENVDSPVNNIVDVVSKETGEKKTVEKKTGSKKSKNTSSKKTTPKPKTKKLKGE